MRWGRDAQRGDVYNYGVCGIHKYERLIFKLRTRAPVVYYTDEFMDYTPLQL